MVKAKAGLLTGWAARAKAQRLALLRAGLCLRLGAFCLAGGGKSPRLRMRLPMRWLAETRRCPS